MKTRVRSIYKNSTSQHYVDVSKGDGEWEENRYFVYFNEAEEYAKKLSDSEENNSIIFERYYENGREI